MTKNKDIIKFVVKNEKEVDTAIILMKAFGDVATYAFSPIIDSISANELGKVLIAKKLNAVLSLQLHKMCDFI